MSDKKRRKKFLYCHIVPEIDDKSPYFNAPLYLPQDVTQKIVNNIDKENMELLKKINIISRSPAWVNCWAKDFEYVSNCQAHNRKNAVIMKQNKLLCRQICQATSGYSVRQYLKEWKTMRKELAHRSRYHGKILERMPVKTDVQRSLVDKTKTRCFFDIGIKEENERLGRIVFELYDTIAPLTCENFAAFCRGTNGLSYKHTPFHRILPGYWCQGGDVTKFNGTGGTSIYGDSFAKENFDLQHIAPGILSMCNNDLDQNDSKFNLTFRRLETPDGNNVVFGRIIRGMVNFRKMEEFGSKIGKPIKTVIVLNCGILSTKSSDT